MIAERTFRHTDGRRVEIFRGYTKVTLEDGDVLERPLRMSLDEYVDDLVADGFEEERAHVTPARLEDWVGAWSRDAPDLDLAPLLARITAASRPLLATIVADLNATAPLTLATRAERDLECQATRDRDARACQAAAEAIPVLLLAHRDGRREVMTAASTRLRAIVYASSDPEQRRRANALFPSCAGAMLMSLLSRPPPNSELFALLDVAQRIGQLTPALLLQTLASSPPVVAADIAKSAMASPSLRNHPELHAWLRPRLHDPLFREAAASTYVLRRDQDAAPALRALFHQLSADAGLQEITRALVECGDEDTPVAAFFNRKVEDQEAIARALAEADVAWPFVRKLLDDRRLPLDLRSTVATLLAERGHKQAAARYYADQEREGKGRVVTK